MMFFGVVWNFRVYSFFKCFLYRGEFRGDVVDRDIRFLEFFIYGFGSNFNKFRGLLR